MNPWDAFAQQTNKWDEDPDIARFMDSFNRPRRAPVQVVHDSRSQPEAGAADGPPPLKERRTSLKLTDFPTEIERPSLPVTPAPIRRSSYFAMNEPEDQNQAVLPIAQGVPRQDEWNPIIKLEELQRRQSLLATGEQNLIDGSKTPPKRDMPDSKSREEAIEAAMRGMNAAHGKHRAPGKPILMEPHFEVTAADDSELGNEQLVNISHMTATGSKSPTRFNPIVLEGEAASERNTSDNTESFLDDEGEPTASHHHTGFSYSTSSLSPESSRTDLNHDMKKAAAEEEIVSPTTVA